MVRTARDHRSQHELRPPKGEGTRSVNTDYLREFVVFAGYMNFTAAAKALNMSQPSLSRHVSELERRYGCELVDRSTPVLRLTHCGRVLLAQAPELIAAEDALEAHLASARRERYGCELVDRSTPVLRLTHCGRVLLAQAPELIAAEDALEAHLASARREPYGTIVVERYRKSPLVQEFMSDALNALKSQHPGFSFTRRALKPGDSAPAAVLRGDLDLGIVACTTDREPQCPVGPEQGFGVCELGAPRERLFFVISRTSPLASRPNLRLDELEGFTFVFPYNPEFNRCLPDVTRLFEERGLKLRSRRHELDEVEELGLMKIGPREVFIVVESAAAAPGSFYLRNPELAIMRSRRHELDEVEELGLMKIGPREVFIVVESAAAAPGSFYLRNPELAIIPCSEDIWVTRYAIYREGDTNPVLSAFLTELEKGGLA